MSQGQDVKSRNVGSALILLCLRAPQRVTRHPHTASYQPSLKAGKPWYASPFSVLWSSLASVCMPVTQIISQGSPYLTLSPDAIVTQHWPSRLQRGLSLSYASPCSQAARVHEREAPCFCSTICGIWGAVVLWIQLCSNEHISQLSFGHGRCNYRAAWGISSASALITSPRSDIRADKFCGCKQQRLAKESGHQCIKWEYFPNVKTSEIHTVFPGSLSARWKACSCCVETA